MAFDINSKIKIASFVLGAFLHFISYYILEIRFII